MSRLNALSRFAVPLLILNAVLMTGFLIGDRARDVIHDPLWWDSAQTSTSSPPPVFHANSSREVVIETIKDQPSKPDNPQCTYCTSQDQRCAEYGKYNLERSRAYEGPSARLKKVIKRARNGEPLKVAVLGGSVSVGHGVSYEQNWVNQVFEWWKVALPHPDNVYINGAVAAITSDYFATCALEHIDEDVDVIFVELAINDSEDIFFAKSYEWLLRLLLAMPKQPAIINVQTMGLGFEKIRVGGDVHLSVAQYYDVPTISLRNVMLQTLLQNPSLEKEFWTRGPDGNLPDYRHIGFRGHKMMADFTISYLERQICAVVEESQHALEEEEASDLDLPSSVLPHALIPTHSSLFGIPSMTLQDEYVPGNAQPDLHPKCASTRSTKNPLVPVHNEGWSLMTWNDKTYLGAGTPGSVVSFEVELGALGLVKLHYLRSAKLGLGDLKCWLDDQPDDATVFHGYWTDPTRNTLGQDPVIVGASPGKHFVFCELLSTSQDPNQGTDFRIVSITSM